MKTKLIKYVAEVLGLDINPVEFTDLQMGKFPFYIGSLYRLYHARLMGHEMVLVELRNNLESIQQIETHFKLLKEKLGIVPVLVVETIQSFQRKRLVEKGINFIVPGQQLYLPFLFIDLRERFEKPLPMKEKLIPSAQCLLIYHLLHRKTKLEQLSLKEVAEMFGYSTMGITKAANNLLQFELCEINGTKDKHILFSLEIPELWAKALPFMKSPVNKTLYVDEKPKLDLLKAGTTALPEYSNMNPSRQLYYAINRETYFNLEKNGGLKNPNELEGEFGLEVWSYNPKVIAQLLNKKPNTVDPLSLYLSMKDNTDERNQGALEIIIENDNRFGEEDMNRIFQQLLQNFDLKVQ